MKPTAKLLAALLTGQLFLTVAAQAATPPAYSAPLNSFIYAEINTAKEHPLKGQLVELLKNAAADTEKQAVLDEIANNIENTTIGFSQAYHQTDGSDIYFLGMSLPAGSFQTIIDNLGTDLSQKDIGQGRMIYLTGDDFFFTYKDGNLLASNIEGLISDLLIQSQPSSIQQNADWQFLQTKSSPDSFLKMLINFENLPAVSDDETLPADFTKFLSSEGLSVQQTPNGFTGLITVKAGPSLGLDPNTYTFIPEIYKSINAQNILFYSESFDWADNLRDSIKLFYEMPSASTQELSITDLYDEISQAVIEATGLDPDTEIAPLFKKRTALAVHSDTELQTIPAFTLVSEVTGMEYKAKEILAKLRTRLLATMQESFNSTYDQEVAYRQQLLEFYKDDPTYQPVILPTKEELQKRFFNTSSTIVNGVTYDQITIDMNADNYFYDESYVSDPKMLLTLSTAVNNNGQMIITTRKNPGDIFSSASALNSDSEWQKSFIAENSMGVSYFNLINLSAYIRTIALSSGVTAEEIAPITDFLSPLKSLFSSNKYESGYYIGTVKANVDLSQLSKMQSLFSQIGESFTSEFSDRSLPSLDLLDPGMFLNFGFKDVPEDAWYGRYVNYMANLGIMRGYGSEFKPGQNITRAEYVKTLLSAYEAAGNTLYGYEPDQYFDDVSADAWYSFYVNQARALGVVKGYSDNTFRPDQPINRAEAMTMLINLRELNNPDYLSGLKEMPFTDVSPDDWFYQSVKKAFTVKYVTGKTLSIFAPNDYLTRAETAAIISRYLENFNQ